MGLEAAGHFFDWFSISDSGGKDASIHRKEIPELETKSKSVSKSNLRSNSMIDE